MRAKRNKQLGPSSLCWEWNKNPPQLFLSVCFSSRTMQLGVMTVTVPFFGIGEFGKNHVDAVHWRRAIFPAADPKMWVSTLVNTCPNWIQSALVPTTPIMERIASSPDHIDGTPIKPKKIHQHLTMIDSLKTIYLRSHYAIYLKITRI